MIRRMTLGLVTAVALAALTATGASAGTTTVIQAIKQQDKIVKSDPTYKQVENLKINTAAQAKAAIPKFKKLATLFGDAADAVAKASATANQKTGQADWVTGARDASTGIRDLATALSDVVNGNKAAGKAEYAKGDKLLDASNTIGDKGDKLLGLPSSD